MRFKNTVYKGNVWFENSPETKRFAILQIDGNNVKVSTDLYWEENKFKIPRILGIFNGLGFVTFLGNLIESNETGMIRCCTFMPDKVIAGKKHFDLKENGFLRKVEIYDEAIVDWIFLMNTYKFTNNELGIESRENFDADITEIKTYIQLKQFPNVTLNHRETRLQNIGCISFEYLEPVEMNLALEYYYKFQSFLRLINGRSKQFGHLKITDRSNNEFIAHYYNQHYDKRPVDDFLKIRYQDIKNDLKAILRFIYLETDKFLCIEKLMENLLYPELSDNKRFTNAIESFEALGKRFPDKPIKKLNILIDHYSDTFQLITGYNKTEMEDFKSKVIRSRDYYVHSNLGNRDIYSKFELLYISYLFDYVTTFQIFKYVKVSDTVLKKITDQGESFFIDLQNTNRILCKF